MMFRSIFVKLLVTYVSIIIFTITVLSFAINGIYNWYVFDQKQNQLEKIAGYVNQLVNSYEKKQISQSELNASLDSMGYISDSKIYVIKIDKAALENPKNLSLGENLEEGYLINDLKKIIDGQSVFRKKQYSEKFDAYVVFEGIPWKTDRGIAGAILMFSPISEISKNITKLNIIIWIAALIFIILSTFVIYYNSNKISKPIKDMEIAAGKIALGEDTEDISIKGNDEIAKLAKTFNYMKHQLLNTEKMRKEFIANVSHDLRTPLTSINGFVEGMLDGIIDIKDYNKYLNIIKDETGRLIKLTNEILSLAKIQSNSIKLQKENINVKRMLDCVLESTKSLLDEKNISISVECKDDVSVYADNDKLKQILINIIDNAVKYNKYGGSIFISVIKEASFVQFCIKDTGIGIPDEDLPFIFEKFYRVDKSRQSLQGGTGLGLNIVKGLIELHGGKIWAKSKLGEGTEIIFQLSC